MKTKNSFMNSIFMMLGVIIIISILLAIMPKDISYLSTGFGIIDAGIGAIIGSVAAGNPITSYVLGGELVMGGASLFFVTALILSWVTVGIIQLPAESFLLGKKFAIYRNALAFLSSIIIALIIVFLIGV
jgi:hypothetical protein